jgi:hypothetical protein
MPVHYTRTVLPFETLKELVESKMSFCMLRATPTFGASLVGSGLTAQFTPELRSIWTGQGGCLEINKEVVTKVLQGR